MKEVVLASRFKKDLKRYRHHHETIEKTFGLLSMLARGESIPEEYRPHKLIGNYAGFMECHVESDTLLVWIDGDVIRAMRLGSHSELFKK